MARRVFLLALGGLCVVPLLHGGFRVSSQVLPQQHSPIASSSPADARCATKADDCLGEKWNAAVRGCDCAPSGVCSRFF